MHTRTPRRTTRAITWLLVPALLTPLIGCTASGQKQTSRTAHARSAHQAKAPTATPATNAEQRNTASHGLREDVRRLFTQARREVFPALVNIHVVTVNYWDGKEQKGASVGSGTIISPDGYIVTNQHVTDNGQRFRCTLTDKREISADLVGEDPLTDIAVLQLDLDELAQTPSPAGTNKLPVAQWGDSAELQIGDYVMAMGSPFSLSRSVTLGIVSNTERVFGGEFGGDEVEEMELEWGQRTGIFTTWIQHDAAINPGNSGGPLVNLAGQIVGVNELGGTNMGFAIPSNLAREVARSLIKRGEVPRSDIGVSFKSIQRTGIKTGVLINSVVKDGPAYQAGIRAGDVLLKLNGDPLEIRFLEQVPPLMKRVADMPIGAKLKVAYQRNGKRHTTTITTEKLKKDKGQEAAFRGWGITAEEITERMARYRRLDSTDGVLVSSMRSGGPAATAEPPLNWGSVIKSVDGQPVKTLDGFIKLYREIMDRDPLPEYLLIEFEQRGQNHLTLLKPKPDEDVDPPREVRKAWIGIATQPLLTQLADQLGYEDRTGFRITRVYPHTNAADSDLQVGDIVIALNGQPLTLRGLQDAGLLAREVRRLDTDNTATLTVLRDGTEYDFTIPLEPTRLTSEEARRDQNRDFELTVREVTFFDRDANRWEPDLKGVLVEQVENAGWAGLGGIRSGDLIQEIDGKAVLGLKSYRLIMDEIAEEQPDRVVFVVLRGVRTHFQFVEPEWNPGDIADDEDEDSTEHQHQTEE